jgi:cilia- and flagella-associated protein 57
MFSPSGSRDVALSSLCVTVPSILNIPMSASFAEREPADYRALTWLPEDRYVVGTRSGELLLFKKEELVTVISGLAAPSAPLAALKSSLGVVGGSGGASLDAGINVLLSCTRGFYCATDSGVVKLFEPVSGSGGSLYSETKSHKLPVTDVVPAVVHMALSPSEEFLAVGTSTNNILQLNLTQADVKGDVSFAPVGVWSHSPMMGTHIGTYTPLKSAVCAITGLDVCVRKPLLVTCGIDCSVRLWNYSLKVQELSKTFPDEPHSVAIHPSGFHVVVGFTDKLRFMNVLMDDLRVIKELSVKACKEVRFSNGGSMFAVASGNLIVVYGTYTCEPVVALR